MSQISAKIKRACINDFELAFKNNKQITQLYMKMKKGTVDESDCYKMADYVSNITNDIFKRYFEDENYASVYQELTQECIYPMLEKNYNIISSYSADMHRLKFENMKLGLNPIEPPVDVNRANGLIDVASNAEKYSDIEKSFSQKVTNFDYHVIDESIKQNSSFMANSGFDTKITREIHGETCEWCKRLAGTYYYPGVDSEVFARHDNCDCTIKVEYKNKPKNNYYMSTSGNAFVRNN